MNYSVLAYYLFVEVADPHAEVESHKKFFEKYDCTGRIYISEEGINGQMSGSAAEIEAYVIWIRQHPLFSSIQFKFHSASETAFPRMSVKYRPQLVALDQKVDVKEGGTHVPPAQWKEMLESGDYLVLDVRNQYEWEIGHFAQAVLPPLQTFREFPAYAEQLKNEVDPASTKVMMYCTGGIRCELFSVLLKKKGFQEVYQLEGGIINYGLQEGNAHWRGKLFVFDDRLAVSIDGQESSPIALCLHCKQGCDVYYNCANMDCNTLFLCCPACLETYQGGCSFACKQAPRRRPLDAKAGNKPFRRKHLIANASTAPKSCSECEKSPKSDQA